MARRGFRTCAYCMRRRNERRARSVNNAKSAEAGRIERMMQLIEDLDRAATHWERDAIKDELDRLRRIKHDD